MKKKPETIQPTTEEIDYWKDKYIKVLEKYTMFLEREYVKKTIKNRGFPDPSDGIDNLYLN